LRLAAAENSRPWLVYDVADCGCTLFRLQLKPLLSKRIWPQQVWLLFWAAAANRRRGWQ
jgi:hypothetical protein